MKNLTSDDRTGEVLSDNSELNIAQSQGNQAHASNHNEQAAKNYQQSSVTSVNNTTNFWVHTQEFEDSELDIPSAPVDQNFFNYFTECSTQQSFVYDILLAHKIADSGMPNRYGCRIPLATGWNLQAMDMFLTDYQDREVLEWLKFGFTIARHDDFPDLTPCNSNHQGANLFPQHVDDYLKTEIQLGATIGPFKVPPFLHRIGVSPLSSRPKKGTDKCRIILNLSFPPGTSVNDGISKYWYCNTEIKLTYPTIDTLARRIAHLGVDCRIWKKDLWRYFRQVPLCPRDFSLIGYRWRNFLYFDKMMNLGLRSATYVCQRVLNSIVYAHLGLGFWSINCLDDFGSAEKGGRCNSQF